MGAAVGDVLWSFGFLARHALLLLLLSAAPTAQRVLAALHPDDPRVYAWPVEMLVAALRVGTLVLVFWLGWREDTTTHREGVGTLRQVSAALGTYLRSDWPRMVVAVLVAAVVFAALNALAGPVIAAMVRHFTADPRIASAWTFGLRNLLVIPLFYAVAYGLVRPAFLRT